MSCPVDRLPILLASYWAGSSFGETCLQGLTWSPTRDTHTHTHLPFGSMLTENMDFDLVWFYFFLCDDLLSFRPSLCRLSLMHSTDWRDHPSLLLPVMSICFISVFRQFCLVLLLLPLTYLSGLLSIHLVNLRKLCHYYCPPIPIPLFFSPLVLLHWLPALPSFLLRSVTPP